MLVKTKLTEKDYINVTFVLFYSKTIMKIITVVIFLSIIINISFNIAAGKGAGSLIQIVFPLVFLALVPLTIYMSAKKNFKRSKVMSESIDYQFDDEYISLKGESFETKFTWDKLYKVTQTKNWVLLWQNSQIANPLHKRFFADNQLDSIREMVRRKKIKNNL